MANDDYTIRRLMRIRDGYQKYADGGFISGQGVCPDTTLTEKDREQFRQMAAEYQAKIDKLMEK